jgi:hypothetical protein
MVFCKKPIPYTKSDPRVTPKEAGNTMLKNRFMNPSKEIAEPFKTTKLVP